MDLLLNPLREFHGSLRENIRELFEDLNETDASVGIHAFQSFPTMTFNCVLRLPDGYPTAWFTANGLKAADPGAKLFKEISVSAFSNSTVKLKTNTCSLKLYRNAKVQVAGCKTPETFVDAIERLVRLLGPGVGVVACSITLVNLSVDFGQLTPRRARLSEFARLARSRGHRVNRPDSPPVCVVRSISEPATTCLVYSTGKFVVTSRSFREIARAYAKTVRMYIEASDTNGTGATTTSPTMDEIVFRGMPGYLHSHKPDSKFHANCRRCNV